VAGHDHAPQAATIFVSAGKAWRDADEQSDLKPSETFAVADVLLGLKFGRWRLLSELVVSSEEQEFERLQVGIEASDNTTVWLGRYHQSTSVWNIFYHHGQYLQTSITRPRIEEWEDEGGLLPHHIIGVLFESQRALGTTAALRTSASLGVAPTLNGAQLVPFDPFGGHSTDNRLHSAIRLEWLPDAVGEDTLGVVASHSDVRSGAPGAAADDETSYQTYGAFFSVSTGRARTLGAYYDLRLSTDLPVLQHKEQHAAWYLQVDYSASTQYTLFAREERSPVFKHLATARQLPGSQSRSVGGLRWQLSARNALSAEVSRNSSSSIRSFTELRLQWSAAFP
jgi:hypothetical protein